MNGPLSLQFRLALVSLCLFLFCFSTTSVLSIKINEIQGTRFISPYNGQTVKEIHGIVTGIDIKYGFYLQDPNPDSNPVTSEGIFVYHPTVTTDPLKLVPGDEIIISEAVVAEFKPKAVSMWMDGTYYNSVTQLTRIQKVRKLSSGKLGSITPSILGGPNMPTEIIFAKDPFEVAASQVHVEALNLPLNLS